MKAIIFDYGGVIFDIEHNLMAEAFARLGVSGMQQYFNHAGQSDLFDALETGAITPEAFRDGVRKLTGLPLDDGQIDEAWNAMLLGILPENFALLEQARKRYRTFLLSNTNAIHCQWISRYLRREHGLDSIGPYFERVYYSFEMGLRKPHKEIFEYVLRAHELEPSETLFIDDSPHNLTAPEALGMRTRLVRKGERLSEVLTPYL